MDDSDAEDDSAAGLTTLAARRAPRVSEEEQGEDQRRVGFLAALQTAGAQGLDWKTSEAWCSCCVPRAMRAVSSVIYDARN